MKNLKLTSLICGGALSLAGGSLMAQQSSSTSPSSSSPTQQSGTSQSGSSQSGSSQLGTSQSGSSQLGTSPSSSSLGTSSSALVSSSSMGSGSDQRISQLMNSPVQSQDGKTLGYLRDLTLDPQSGRVQFAIIALSSAAGASDTSTSGRETVPSSRSSVAGTPSSSSTSSTMGKLVPVPWQLFSQSSGSQSSSIGSSSSTTSTAMSSHGLKLSIDESKLRSAPTFESTDWSQLQGGTMDQRVYSYFGVDRSSATGTPGSSISGQGAGSEPRSGSSTTSPQSGSSSSTTSPQSGSSSSTSPQSGSSSSSSTTSPQSGSSSSSSPNR